MTLEMAIGWRVKLWACIVPSSRWGRENPVWNKMRQILNEIGYTQVVEGVSGVWYD